MSLNIDHLFSESDLDAERSRKSLHEVIERLVESNEDLSRRLMKLENVHESESVLTVCFRNGSDVEGGVDDAGVIQGRGHFDNISSDLPRTSSKYSFEADLNTSRVYQRTQPYECDVSFTSSAIRTHAWSVFSGMSLSQISTISAIALPVYSHEVFNDEWYNFVFFDHSQAGRAAASVSTSDSIAAGENKKSPSAVKRSSNFDGTLPVQASIGTGIAIAEDPNILSVHRVQLDFTPSLDDELKLRVGQLVRIHHEYDDGWVSP